MVEYRIPLDTSNPFRLRSVCVWLLTGLLLLALLAYIAYQARFLLVGPQISIEPAPATALEERTITIRGAANNISRITLNGRQIYTDPEGTFAELVVLHEGYNLLTIAAVDRYGRTSEVEQTYVYNPPSLIQ